MQSLSKRLLSLDIFRGLTIAGMILVNSPGNDFAHGWLEHAPWHGMTPTDLIFPFFLFIVGITLVFSLEERLKGSPRSAVFALVLKRTVILFGLGLLLNGFPSYNLDTIRIPGVLQRIALCYFVGSLFYLYTTISIQIGAATVLLFSYWWLMTHLQAPGFPVGDLTLEGNFAAYIDRALFGNHMYRPAYDPEGLLSTIPAIANVLLGNLTGYWLRSGGSRERKVTGCLQAGFVFLLAGWKCAQYFPLNKALWTSSYVLLSTGWALVFFGLVYWAIEIKGWKAWSKPFEILGVNAIAAYVLHILFLKIQNLWKMPRLDGSPGNIRIYFTEHFFQPFLSPENASLAYALVYTLLWYIFFWYLFRKRILIKI